MTIQQEESSASSTRATPLDDEPGRRSLTLEFAT
jgi:hypothetical protein